MQCSTVQYSTVQYSTVQYSTVQYSTAQHSTVQYSTVQYSTVQYSTVQYSTVQHSTVQHRTVQYNTVQPWVLFTGLALLLMPCCWCHDLDRATQSTPAAQDNMNRTKLIFLTSRTISDKAYKVSCSVPCSVLYWTPCFGGEARRSYNLQGSNAKNIILSIIFLPNT